MLVADDAGVVNISQELQSLMDRFCQVCKDFGLTVSLKKTNIMGQDTEALRVITITDYELNFVCKSTCLGSAINSKPSLDTAGP